MPRHPQVVHRNENFVLVAIADVVVDAVGSNDAPLLVTVAIENSEARLES